MRSRNAWQRRLLSCGLVCLAVAASAPPAGAFDQLASGLQAAVGVAIDSVHNHLYFVEYNAATASLKRLVLTPECETDASVACTVDSVPVNLGHPEDVVLDTNADYAYVTTRDDPGTGGLWRIDTATGAKQLVAFNLGAPQQLVMDLASNSAYTVGFDDGRLRRIDLTTGAKIPLFTGLDHPVGLALTADGRFAYVTEQGASNLISKIDLTLGTRVIGEEITGFTAPFFLSWTDASENAFYLLERNPSNRLVRVDLSTSGVTQVDSVLPSNPSAVDLRSASGPLFVTSDAEISRIDLTSLLPGPSEPVFTQVGHVPWSEIDLNGYADTSGTGYFYQVKDSPFGGTINIFGNLSHFRGDLGASHYEVQVSKDGGPFVPMSFGWTAYRWNTDPTVAKYEPVAIAPDPGTTLYAIPDDYPLHAARWVPPFLMMRWPSGENGVYELQVTLFEETGPGTFTLIAFPPLDAAKNRLTLRIDNTRPEAEILRICQQVSTAVPFGDPCLPRREVKACDIVTDPANNYTFGFRAYDPNGHLRYYRMRAFWGKNGVGNVVSTVHYVGAPANPLAPLWYGELNATAPAAGWSASCDCAHTFELVVGKRTINGYNYLLWDVHRQSVTINNTSTPCPL
jgi:hypothetical protein